ncbi:YtxH domain-containing protein [Streptococcus dentapri]|uniref:YtxH domain-containing protein n=1 Tax=Streptococcus dentapri TaxID=573564 RepID=A0ABV8D2Q1_9STRE
MGKLVKTFVVSTAVGAAAGYFLLTDKGKEVKKKAIDLVNDYKDNSEAYNQAAKEKAGEYRDLALNTFHNYKEKFETGELTKEDIFETVKEKAAQANEFANEKAVVVKDKLSKIKEEPGQVTQAEVDDIVIDYSESNNND